MRAESAEPERVRVGAGPIEPDRPVEVTRRGFFARMSLGALGAFAVVAAVPEVARAGRPQPPPCRVRCSPISRTGCACGGALYHCRGCSTSFHACVTGKPFRPICLRRRC